MRRDRDHLQHLSGLAIDDAERKSLHEDAAGLAERWSAGERMLRRTCGRGLYGIQEARVRSSATFSL